MSKKAEKPVSDRADTMKVPIAVLKGDPKNARKISKESLAGLGVSLAEFADLSGIVWNERTGELVCGHQRLKALREAGAIEWTRQGDLGWLVHPETGERFQIRIVDWDETRQRMANLVANNPQTQGEYTDDVVDQLRQLSAEARFDELRLVDLQKQLDKDLAEAVAASGNTDPDAIPDTPPEPITKLGDLWALGEHRLLCGDSTDPKSVARLMGSEKAVLMNTDPPYGINYSKTKDGIPRSGFADHQEHWGDIENDGLTDGPTLQAFLESVIRSALPHLKKGCAFYLWHPMLTQGTFFAAAAAADI